MDLQDCCSFPPVRRVSVRSAAFLILLPLSVRPPSRFCHCSGLILEQWVCVEIPSFIKYYSAYSFYLIKPWALVFSYHVCKKWRGFGVVIFVFILHYSYADLVDLCALEKAFHFSCSYQPNFCNQNRKQLHFCYKYCLNENCLNENSFSVCYIRGFWLVSYMMLLCDWLYVGYILNMLYVSYMWITIIMCLG